MQVATRKACGLALAKLGHANDRVIVLDGDTKNSTFSEIFKKEYPERFIECFIAEQNMVRVLGDIPLASSPTCPVLTVFLSICIFFKGHIVQHMEVPQLGVELELQPAAYTTATAMQDPQPTEQDQGSNMHPHG